MIGLKLSELLCPNSGNDAMRGAGKEVKIHRSVQHNKKMHVDRTCFLSARSENGAGASHVDVKKRQNLQI